MTSSNRAAALAQLGTAISPPMLQGTMALYAPVALRPEAMASEVRRDLTYGSDERHRVDLFLPNDCSAPLPIVLFVHGGGFVGGDKGGVGAPFYNNFGAWAAREGLIGATMTYRLAPHAQWPAGSEDLADAVSWLRDTATGFGGDPERIVVVGQSAGAAHVAGYIAHPDFKAAQSVAGAAMLSGIYDLEALHHSPMENAYYGTQADTFADRSSLAGLAATRVPCLFSVSEFDPPSFQQQAARVVAAVTLATGSWPKMLYLPGHNHLSPVLALGLEDDAIGPEISRFVRMLRPDKIAAA